MIDYTHTKTVLFSEGPAKAKIISLNIRQRRDPEQWANRVDTLVIKLAVIHAVGKKDVYEDSIPITRSFAWRIDELRKALGETLPDDDDPARANWNEQTAIDEVVFVWFTVWKNDKKSGNNIKYLLPLMVRKRSNWRRKRRRCPRDRLPRSVGIWRMASPV